MTDQEVIVTQTKELYEIKEKLIKQEIAIKSINTIIHRFVCMGGPLNDNNLQFNKDQIKYLDKIYREITNICNDFDSRGDD